MMKNPLQNSLKSILLLFTLSFFFCLKALPQKQHLIDSLKNVIAITKYDTNRLKLFLEIGEQYRNTIPDTALYYYQEALEIAENMEAKELIAKTLIRIGSSRQFYDSPEKAIEYLERALKISEEISDKEKITSCYVYASGLLRLDG